MKRFLRLVLVTLIVFVISAPSANADTENVHEIDVDIQIIEHTELKTHLIVNDVTIILETNDELTQGVLTINEGNLFNSESHQIFNSKHGDEYLVSIVSTADNGLEKTIANFSSEINLLQADALSGNIAVDEAPQSSSNFFWDRVRFVPQSHNIPYPRPDVDHYGMSYWLSYRIDGLRLHHYMIGSPVAQTLMGLAPAALGAALGAYIGGVGGAVVGTLLGFVVSTVTPAMFLDDRNCLWFWVGQTVNYRELGGVLAHHPDYFRVARYTLWNYYGTLYNSPVASGGGGGGGGVPPVIQGSNIILFTE
ncbi:MAG: hypothetical protein FH749_15140 [Firmicutes bacterium]|nr:hypothetical protein [Bacillota bacterium]